MSCHAFRFPIEDSECAVISATSYSSFQLLISMNKFSLVIQTLKQRSVLMKNANVCKKNTSQEFSICTKRSKAKVILRVNFTLDMNFILTRYYIYIYNKIYFLKLDNIKTSTNRKKLHLYHLECKVVFIYIYTNKFSWQ